MAKVVLVLGDDISTDIIYPGRYMATVLPTETPQFAFADLTDFNGKLVRKEVGEAPVLVAGKNFGCGSSREQAVSTLVGHNLTVVAKHFARIFFQNSINLGLKTVICPSLEASEGDDSEVGEWWVNNETTGKRFPRLPLSSVRKGILQTCTLIPYTRKRLSNKR